jgi:hypothetical protein
LKSSGIWTCGFIVVVCVLAMPSQSEAVDPVFAVDISIWSGEITADEVACWRANGVRHVIAGTQVASVTVQQLETAVSGGMTVAAYVMLYWDYNITDQVNYALGTIQGLPVRRLWLDAEQPRGNWASWQLIDKIQEAIDACGSFPHGIYTRKVWWRDNVADTAVFSHLPLWYAYYDGYHDFEDWYDPLYWYEGPFGGWTDPTGKQYASDWTFPDLCGVNLDYNIMYVGAASGSLNGEVGKVTVNQSGGDQWHWVDLVHSYEDPVVIMQPPSFNGGHPSTIRLRNVTANGFEFQIDEWDYLDSGHTTETMGFIVMDAGVFELDDGTRVEVGKVLANQDFTPVSLSQTFAQAPVVLSQSQTANDASAIVTRQRDVGVDGFEVRLQEEEANDQVHGYETVGYLAIEAAVGSSGNMAFEAQTTADAVTHNWSSVVFQQSYSDPVFIGGVHGYDGGNTIALRYRNLASTGVEVFVEEEQSLDAEIGHTTEVAAYLVFDQPGSLNGDGLPAAPTGLSPDGGQTITTSSVTLSCDPITDAIQYEFEISYSEGVEWLYYYSYSSSTNSQTFWPAHDDTAYRWRVRASNGHGWGAWSAEADFNFGDVGGSSPPPAPTGLSPDDGVTITTSSVTLSCNAVSGANQYQFEIHYWNGSAWQYYYSYTLATNSQEYWPSVHGTSYLWRVRAQNLNGWGPWSADAEFYFN